MGGISSVESGTPPPLDVPLVPPRRGAPPAGAKDYPPVMEKVE